MFRKILRTVTALTIPALVLGACGGETATPTPVAPTAAPTVAATNTSAPPTEPTTATSASAATPTSAAQATSTTGSTSASMRDPKDVALEAAGGKQLGGTIDFMGVLGGAEQEKYLSMLKPFEDATGVKIQYESTRDLSAVLQTRVEGGNPPDIVSNPGIGEMIGYATTGKLIALDQLTDMAVLKEQFDPSLLNTVSVSGKAYGLFQVANLEGLVWYNPKTYTGPKSPKTWAELESWANQEAAAGKTPWCVGLESGAATGWPAAIWITEQVLLQAGPKKYDQWAQGKLPFTSPEVKAAFESFGKIVSDPKMVNGGPTAALSVSFMNAGDPMFKQPPGCSLLYQASFMGDIMMGNNKSIKAGEDVDYFAFPDVKPEYSGMRQISGEVVGVFKDTPQTRALISYMSSPEAGAILAQSGGWLSTNKHVSPSMYPSPFTKRAAEVLSTGSQVHYDAFGLMPGAVTGAFLKGIVRYVQNPELLDSVLADLDAAQKEAYK